jgi:hypothetical protein
LTHVARGDARGQLLFNLAFPLLYFHPLYWWLRSRVHLADELIADDEAADAAGKLPYVQSLIAVARRHGQGVACLSSQSLFGSQSQFFRRMQMLLTRRTRLDARCSRHWRWFYPAACALTVGLAASVFGVGPSQAENGPGEEELTRAKQQIETLRKENDQLRRELEAFKAQTNSRASWQPDLVVSQKGVRDRLTSTLPEELGDRIAAIPGVHEVNKGLVDLVAMAKAGPVVVVVQGWPVDAPVMKRLNITSGRGLETGDKRGVLLGEALASKSGTHVGDKIAVFEETPDFTVVGIYRGKSIVEDGMVIMLLSDLQAFMGKQGKVGGFAIVLDHPKEENEVQRIGKEIEKLGNVDVLRRYEGVRPYNR